MATKDAQRAARRLAKRQHWAIARVQLLALGFTPADIRHRIAKGRLHRIWAGIYAVDRPELTQEGLFAAAVLACGEGAVLSHISAAILWGLIRVRARVIEVSVPLNSTPRREGIKIHRRKAIDGTRHKNIPVTSPTQTLLDLDPEELRTALER